MIVGIGIDIVEIERIEKIHERFGNRFARRLLCENEMDDYMRSTSRSRMIAKRFAAKEAAVKALGTGFSDGVALRMICVEHDARGRPELRFMERAASLVEQLGAAHSRISISDEQHYSVAVVVLESACTA